MSLRTKFGSSLLSLTIAAGTMAGTVEQSAAKKLSKGEIAAIAGVGGFVLGLGIANANRGPGYHRHHHGYANSWQAHVNRCYARYRTYSHHTDTYIGHDGYQHYCRL